MRDRSREITAAFDQAAELYELHGVVQKKAALELMGRLPKWLEDLPEGPAIELGCGTGLLSEYLSKKLGARPFTITDLSGQMLQACQAKLEAQEGLTFLQRDAAEPLEEGKYALVASALSLQWLKEPYQGLANYCRALKPGGRLVLSVMTEGSFPQWREAAHKLGVPFTANRLPEGRRIEELLAERPGNLEFAEREIPVKFAKARDFFFNLKAIGASTALEGARLNPGQMKRLLQELDSKHPEGLTMGHKVCFACYRRDEVS